MRRPGNTPLWGIVWLAATALAAAGMVAGTAYYVTRTDAPPVAPATTAPATTPPPVWEPKPGDIARLTRPDNPVLPKDATALDTPKVPVAVDISAYDAFMKAVRASDDHGATEVMAKGKVFGVTTGSEVRVLELYPPGSPPGTEPCEVRVMYGDHAGRVGYVMRVLLAPPK